MNKVFNNLEKKSKRNSLEKLISRAKFKVDEKNSLLYNNEKKNKHSKYCSTHEIADVAYSEDIIIDENFVTNSLINFAYDYKKVLYNISKNVNNNTILNEIVKKEANDIIKAYSEINKN